MVVWPHKVLRHGVSKLSHVLCCSQILYAALESLGEEQERYASTAIGESNSAHHCQKWLLSQSKREMLYFKSV